MSTVSSSESLASPPILGNSDTIIIRQLREIYSILIQLQATTANGILQLQTRERQELWSSIVQLWLELSVKTSDILIDEHHIVTDCLSIITTISHHLIDSKSVFDMNDPKSAEKAFSTCMIMLNLPHIRTYLCRMDVGSDELIAVLNVHLMLTVAIQSAPFLSTDAIAVFNEQKDLFILLMNYVEKRINSAQFRSGPIVERVLTFFWNVSDRTFFVPTLVETGLPEHVIYWLSYSNTGIYEHCISLNSIIHNLSRHDAGVDALNKYEAIEIIKEFQHKHINIPNEEISLLIPMILAQLCSPEQLKRDKKIMNGVLNQLLQRTINASNNNKLWYDAGFHVSEFLAVLVKLFVVEERTLDYILCHAETEPSSDMSSTIRLFSSLLLSFGEALNKNNQLEQFTLIAVLNILWSISFQTQYLQELLINNKEAVVLVENLAQNYDKEAIDQYKPRSMEGIPEAAHGIIHNIQKYSESQTTLNNTQKTLSKNKPSIMISYSHDDKMFCKELLDFLLIQNDKFDVWIDQIHCQTAEDIWEMIAIGMEQANIIVCLISDYYFQSKSCRQEFIYASDTLRKLIIPVLLGHFKPKGWLGIRIPGIKYIRFPNLAQSDQVKMDLLLDTILATLALSTTSSTEQCYPDHQDYGDPTASHSEEDPEVHLQFPLNQWTVASSDDIKAWFSRYHLSTELRDLYSFQTGEEMLHYGEQLLENYDKHIQIYSRAFAKKYNGDELLPHEFQRFTQAIKELLKWNQISTAVVSS